MKFGQKTTMLNQTIDLSNVAMNYINRKCYRHYMTSYTNVNKDLQLDGSQIGMFVNQYYYVVPGFRSIQEKMQLLR